MIEPILTTASITQLHKFCVMTNRQIEVKQGQMVDLKREGFWV